jgi:hypothetical protein
MPSYRQSRFKTACHNVFSDKSMLFLLRGPNPDPQGGEPISV